MSCEIHHLKCNEICIQKHCQKPWFICHRCNNHTSHQTILSVDFYNHISKIVENQNHFQITLKQYLLQTINNELQRMLEMIKTIIQNTVCDKLRSTIRSGKLGSEPEIELAVREFERDGIFKQKYRNKLVFMDLDIGFEKEIQKQIKEREIYNIQTVFFNLLSSIKDTIHTSDPNTLSAKKQLQESSNKMRSYSGKSNNTASNVSLYGRKRKISLATKHGLFKDTTTKQIKIKKIMHQGFNEQPTQIIDKGQKFLKALEHKLAARIEIDKVMIQEPNMKVENKIENGNNQKNIMTPNYVNNIPSVSLITAPLVTYTPSNPPSNVASNLLLEVQNIKTTNSIQETKNKVQKIQNPKKQLQQNRPIKQSLSSEPKQVRRTVQRSSVKVLDLSKLQQKNKSTNLKKGTKIQKRVDIIHNKHQQVQQTIQLEQQIKLPPKTIQQIEARLKIVPEINGFLKQNLSSIQQTWKQSNNICWKMYFELKDKIKSKQSKYQEQQEQTKSLTYSRADIVDQLEFNIKNTNIKTISRPRNHLILQYLVKYTAEILILFQGLNITQTKFSAQKYLETLNNLADGNVKGAFAYMNGILLKIKDLV